MTNGITERYDNIVRQPVNNKIIQDYYLLTDL